MFSVHQLQLRYTQKLRASAREEEVKTSIPGQQLINWKNIYEWQFGVDTQLLRLHKLTSKGTQTKA